MAGRVPCGVKYILNIHIENILMCLGNYQMMMMMTSAQVVETSVNVSSNSPSQDYTHPDDHNLPNYDMTPGFKPFTHLQLWKSSRSQN